MKLKTVGHMILLNEPLLWGSGSYLTPPDIDRFAHYVECHGAIFDALGRRGLPMKLVGPDSCTMATWAIDHMSERGLDLAPYVDAFDQHCYHARFDYLPPNPTIAVNHSIPMGNLVTDATAMHAGFSRAKGKKYWITEIGTFYYGGPRGDVFGPCTHEAFLTEAEFIIRAAKVGCGCFCRWAFLAPGEYGDGVWQFINTVDDSYTRQPHTFHGYACLMRYTERGAAVWPALVEPTEEQCEHVHAAGLEMPGGGYTILVVNDHNSQERIVTIEVPQGWKGSWQRLVNDRTRKMIRNDLSLDKNTIVDALPPMSLTVYTTRRLDDDGRIELNKCSHRPEAAW
jgi:hypothetical protein